MNEDIEPKGRAKGGYARAEALTAKERSDNARKAALARWSPNIPTATHIGVLKIGDLEISCAVLGDGQRVLSQGSLGKALGMTIGGYQRRKRALSKDRGGLPLFLVADNLKPFISDEFISRVSEPITYKSPHGGSSAIGTEASLLPEICEIWLNAKDKGALLESQKTIAERANILMRGLARVGIIALVDEATGYQETRDRLALQAILDAFLRKEFAAWAKRFPDEFYQHIFRLRGWEWKGRRVNPPQIVAYYTKDIVYARLAPHILEELEARNPVENGKRKAKFHQWLTDDIGHPALAQHLHAVITLMRVSQTWDQFKIMLDMAHPRRGDTLQLPFMSDFSSNELPLLTSQ